MAARKPTKPVKKTPPRMKRSQVQRGVAERKAMFIESYLSNGENGSKAAIAAGYSKRSAGQIAHRLLKIVEIQSEIEQRRQELMLRAKLNTEEILVSLRQCLLFDPRKLFDEKGIAKPPHLLDDDTAKALTGVEVKINKAGKITLAKYKIPGRDAAREQAARMLGLFEKDNRQRTDPLTALVREIGSRGSTLPTVE